MNTRLENNEQLHDEREKEMFGCTVDELIAGVEGSILVQILSRKENPTPQERNQAFGMVAMSMMSDAQEMIAAGQREAARLQLNRARSS
jgi:hypothetical protein